MNEKFFKQAIQALQQQINMLNQINEDLIFSLLSCYSGLSALFKEHYGYKLTELQQTYDQIYEAEEQEQEEKIDEIMEMEIDKNALQLYISIRTLKTILKHYRNVFDDGLDRSTHDHDVRPMCYFLAHA